MKRKRPRLRYWLAYTPQWEGPIQSWARSFIKKNKWRCDRVFDFNDLLQDAYVCFLHVADTYPRVIEAPHFMALFQRAMINKMHDRARSMQKRMEFDGVSLDSDPVPATTLALDYHEGYVRALIQQAPEDVKLALAIVSNNPEAFRNRYEGFDVKLRHMLGFDKSRLDERRKFNLAVELRALFAP